MKLSETLLQKLNEKVNGLSSWVSDKNTEMCESIKRDDLGHLIMMYEKVLDIESKYAEIVDRKVAADN